jgi:peptidoglycan/LPS O-acetylase OafA/YrhL
LFAFFAVFLTHTLPHDAAFYASHHISQLAAGLLIAVANAGAFGVSLFFMLSAYLITSLLLQEMQKTGTIALGSFYLRRILRIWPLYFFALALAALWPDPAWRMPGNYVLAYLLLAGNWMTVLIGPPHTFASILWSVSIEEQFYLSWPLLAKWLRRDRLAYGCVAIIAIANLSRIALTLSPLRAAEMLPNTLAQLDVIAVGALIAVAGVQSDARATSVAGCCRDCGPGA